MSRELILAEWHRAQQALRAADVLTREHCFADAISRTYYAVLYAARAALQAAGVSAETHAGVRRMFGLHLIKTGLIETEYAVVLAESFDDRLSADYNAQVTFNQSAARDECRAARRFLRRVRRFLNANGFSNYALRPRRAKKHKSD